MTENLADKSIKSPPAPASAGCLAGFVFFFFVGLAIAISDAVRLSIVAFLAALALTPLSYFEVKRQQKSGDKTPASAGLAYVVGGILLVSMLIAGVLDIQGPPSFITTSDKSPEHQQDEAVTDDGLAEIDASSNGYDWKRTSEDGRRQLTDNMASRIGKHTGSYYYDAINAFYNTDEPSILEQEISQIAGIAGVMPSDSEQSDSLNEATQNGDISAADLEIYNFMQARWDYYEERDGEYEIGLHDALVSEEAGEKFGVTADEAIEIFKKVEGTRLGLDEEE